MSKAVKYLKVFKNWRTYSIEDMAEVMQGYSDQEFKSEFKSRVKAISKKINKLLIGINKDECEDKNGWWETSSGAEFGAKILKKINKLLKQ